MNDKRTLVSAHVLSASVLVAAAMKLAVEANDTATVAALTGAANSLLDARKANLIAVSKQVGA